MGGRGVGGNRLLGSLPPSLHVPTKNPTLCSYAVSMTTLNMLTCNELCVFVLTKRSLKAGALSSSALGSPQGAYTE